MFRSASKRHPSLYGPSAIFITFCSLFINQTSHSAIGQEPVKLFKHVDTSTNELTHAQQRVLNRLKTQQTSVDEPQIVRLDVHAFDAAEMVVNINANTNVHVHRSRPVNRTERGFTWTGNVESNSAEKKPTPAQFFVKGDSGMGNLQVGKFAYSLRPIGKGLHALIKRDPSKIGQGENQKPEEPKKFNVIEQQAEKKALPQFAVRSNPLAESRPPVVEVMVVYTPAVKAGFPEDDADELVEEFIAGVVNLTNETYALSNVPVRIHLAHLEEVDYTESGSVETDVDHLRIANDNSIDNIHTLRDHHKADVVVMLIEDADAYGMAAAILAESETAFAVVDDEVADWYFTFAHELGHLFGCRHNDSADSSTAPFAYGHGFQDTANGWRTVMAYDCPANCIRHGIWSSPLLTGPPPDGAHTAGTSDINDNCRVLRETAALVASFR